MHNKFAYVKGLRTSTFDKQLKATAKAIYAGDQANKQVTRTEKFMNNWVAPFVNAIVTGKRFIEDLRVHFKRDLKETEYFQIKILITKMSLQ